MGKRRKKESKSCNIFPLGDTTDSIRQTGKAFQQTLYSFQMARFITQKRSQSIVNKQTKSILQEKDLGVGISN